MNVQLQKDDRISIARLLSQVMDTQQQSILQFNNMSIALESIRAEIRRTDENHAKEVERLHEIIAKLLPQQQIPQYYPQMQNAGTFNENYFLPQDQSHAAQMPQQHYDQLYQSQPITPAPSSAMPHTLNLLCAPIKHHSSPAESATPIPATAARVSHANTTTHAPQVIIKKEPIDTSRDITSDSSEGEPWETVALTPTPPQANSQVKQQEQFGTGFVKKADQWECANCYVINEARSLHCLACSNSKNGNTMEISKSITKTVLPSANPAPTKFTFGLTKPLTPQKSTESKEKVSFADAAKEVAEKESAEASRKSTSGITPNMAKSFLSFTQQSGSSATEKTLGGKPTENKSNFNFAIKSTEKSHLSITKAKVGSLFNTPSSLAAAGEKTDGKNITTPARKIFGSTGSTVTKTLTACTLFDEQSKKQAQEDLAKQKSSKFGMNIQKIETKEENEGAEEEFEPDIVVKPIYPLPDLIDVVTGEENEKVEFQERCKLFRWASDTKEWKERGAGEMKILVDEKSRARCVMRREQTFKLVCNFRLTSKMKIDKMPKNEKACVWLCIDFSEDTSSTEKFSARFSSPEKANEFRKKCEEYCK